MSLLCASVVCAQTKIAKNYHDFVPKGYDTLDVSEGDLNGDQHDDIVLVCARIHSPDSEDDVDDTNSRPLIVLFWTPNGYQFILRNDDVIECKGCGGIFGDPFTGTEIKKGVLTISHYGGSNWRWEFVRKFKRVNNELALIGKTNRSYWDVKFCKRLNDFAGTDVEDVNLLTGKRYRKKISQECKLIVDRWDRIDVKPLIPLSEYKMESTGE